MGAVGKLIFKYGTMNSGKSIDLLKTNHSYREYGKKTLVYTTKYDNRFVEGKVASRIGISTEAILFDKDFDFIDSFYKYYKDKIDCVLIDEAQFLTKEQVLCLSSIANNTDVTIIAYGLKTDFQNKLFEGSEALIIYASYLEEIKTVCAYCNEKAKLNLRIHNGKPIYKGEQIQIGGNESYIAVCCKHYISPKELK